MSQAKVLSEAEIKRVLAVVDHNGKLAARNRLVVMLSFLGGMRAGEIASLKLHHVVNENGSVRDRIHLAMDETKGKRGRTVMMGKKLQKEIARYMGKRRANDLSAPRPCQRKIACPAGVLILASLDEKPIPIFQDICRSYPPCRDDVYPLPPVVAGGRPRRKNP